jgi:predicted aminopeptidase
VAGSCLLAGCGEIEFYWQGIVGQTEIVARARPIDEVIAATPDPVLKARLSRAQAIRAFASRELALPDNRSYTNYADLGRPYAVWNVFAAPELSLSPRQWCFPIAGCVSYRGYFAESDARAEAARISAAGDDVHVGGVPAYSTLGYFDDPVLSTFVRYREVELARLIFHELAHQVVYVKDDTSFNESFATAVEEAGIARWLAVEVANRDQAEAAALKADAARGQRLRATFRALVATTRDRLAALYASTASDAEKRAGKAEAFAAMHAEYERQKAEAAGVPSFDRWFAGGANNAGIVAAGLYTDRVPQFTALLAAEGGDLVRFYARVIALAAMPAAQREAALAGASRS